MCCQTFTRDICFHCSNGRYSYLIINNVTNAIVSAYLIYFYELSTELANELVQPFIAIGIIIDQFNYCINLSTERININF